MAGGIKGITIEIGGNTAPLDKALKDVNKTSRDLQSELKEVNKQLKLDPTNTVLLQQKQKLLADSVVNTNGKLGTLKEAERQAQEQFKKGKISEEQYRALQREVIKTEQSLQNLESQALKANAVLSKDQAVGNLKNMGKAAGVAAVAVGAAFVGVAVAAVNTADELQRQADVTGLSAERLQELQYAGNNLGVELETITGAQAKLTKSMASAKDGTGAQAESFKTLEISILDSNGQMRDSKTVMGEAFTALGKVGNETERDALAMSIFGKSAMDMNPLIKAGGDELNRLSEEAKSNGSVMSNEAVAGLDLFGDTMDNLKNSILGSLGEKLSELLPKAQEFLDKLKELPQWIQQNSTLLTIIGIIIGTITVLIIAFNIQQALLASGMTLWGAITAGTTIVTTGLGAALTFLTSPIALVIIAIAAIIAIGFLLYKNWDTIKEKAGELGSFLGIKFNQIKEAIMTPIRSAGDFIGNQIDRIKAFFSGLKIELPKIKLPHFSITGKFDLLNIPPKIPSLGVEWYDKGGIFNSPQIIGVGEKRPEFVGAIDDLKDIMRGVMNEKNGNSGLNVNIESFVNNRKQDVQAFAEELEFYRRQKELGTGGA